MSMGKLSRKSTSHKLRKREKEAAEALASENALAREQAIAHDFEERLKRNKVLILSAIAVVVVGGGVYATQDSRTEAAQAELTDLFREATMAAQGKVVKAGALDTSEADGANPMTPPTFESPEERYETIESSFQAVVDKKAGSGAAHLATLGLAATALQKGDGDTATKHLDSFLAKEKDDTVFRRRALVMQAHALEAQGKSGDAAARLATMAKEAHEEVKRLAASAAAQPSEAIDERLTRAKNRSADLYIEAASMFRRADMADKAVALLKTVTEDENLKTSTERYRADEGLNVLGQKGT